MSEPQGVPPDPVTGWCPRPSTPGPFGIQSELEKAAAIATYVSLLEARGDIALLYKWMHPHAQASIPEEVVTGWYAENWTPLEPELIQVSRVAIVEWTWPVSGTVYPSAAEISYHQRFADGSETDGVVHLVRNHGVWRWFFGSSRAFVDEQLARYGGLD